MTYITIRFVFEPGLVSKLIGWQTDSLWCHTEALSRDGQSWIGAHAGTGVQARKLNWMKPVREARYAVQVTDEQYDAAMTWLESKIGEPYDYADIVGLALHRRLGASDHEIICSALMTEFMQNAGIRPLNCLEGYDYLITPETLHLSSVFIGKRVVL
jgi:uncharacterized protein YycO